MPRSRVYATSIVLAGLVVGLTLSVRRNYYPDDYKLTAALPTALVAALVAYLCALGVERFARDTWLEDSARFMRIVLLAPLGVLSVLQAPGQLERFALENAPRTPDPFAVALGVGGGVVALSQSISQFLKRPFLAHSLAFTLLVFLNVYLCIAAF